MDKARALIWLLSLQLWLPSIVAVGIFPEIPSKERISAQDIV